MGLEDAELGSRAGENMIFWRLEGGEEKQMFYFVHFKFKMPVRHPSTQVRALRPQLSVYKLGITSMTTGKGQIVGGSNIVNLKRSAHRQKLGSNARVHHSFVHGAQRVQLWSGDEDNVWHEL